MELYLNPRYVIEAQEDHLTLMYGCFLECVRDYQLFRYNPGTQERLQMWVERAEKFYPNHPITIKMRTGINEV